MLQLICCCYLDTQVLNQLCAHQSSKDQSFNFSLSTQCSLVHVVCAGLTPAGSRVENATTRDQHSPHRTRHHLAYHWSGRHCRPEWHRHRPQRLHQLVQRVRLSVHWQVRVHLERHIPDYLPIPQDKPELVR